MVTKQVIYCDGCNKPGGAILAFRFFVGRESSPAGDRENILESIDLCHNCTGGRLCRWMEHDPERGAMLFKILSGQSNSK